MSGEMVAAKNPSNNFRDVIAKSEAPKMKAINLQRLSGA